METQGVDIHALLRRLAPRWLGWLGCGVVGLWLWSSVTTVAAFNIPQTDTTVYDQFGNLVAAQGIGTDVDWLGRIALSLTMGFPGPPAARELALLCLAGTAAVVLLWVTHRRDGHIRAVAAAGLAVSLGVAVVGGLAFASRTALAEAVTRFGWGVGEMSGFDSQFAAWGVTGGIGAVFAWAFLVMGFHPLPRLPAPLPAPLPASAPEPSPESSGPLPEPAGGPPPESAGVMAGTGVDVVPAAPPPDLSLFERPAGWAGTTDEGSDGATARSVGDDDPLSAYRRPEPLDQS